MAIHATVFCCTLQKAGDILGSTLTREEALVDEWVIPKCMKCEIGQLVPLSDYGGQGAAVHYKAWVCTNPTCGFNLPIRNGEFYLNEPITPGGMPSQRNR